MEQFHLRVQQFNRELQGHLDTSLAFESITKVMVEVVSTIKELKYWPAICEMAESHLAWRAGDADELPPLEFGVLRPNRRNFQTPRSSPVKMASKSIEWRLPRNA